MTALVPSAGTPMSQLPAVFQSLSAAPLCQGACAKAVEPGARSAAMQAAIRISLWVMVFMVFSNLKARPNSKHARFDFRLKWFGFSLRGAARLAGFALSILFPPSCHANQHTNLRKKDSKNSPPPTPPAERPAD